MNPVLFKCSTHFAILSKHSAFSQNKPLPQCHVRHMECSSIPVPLTPGFPGREMSTIYYSRYSFHFKIFLEFMMAPSTMLGFFTHTTISAHPLYSSHPSFSDANLRALHMLFILWSKNVRRFSLISFKPLFQYHPLWTLTVTFPRTATSA